MGFRFFGGFQIVFTLMFLLVFGIILVQVIRGIWQWNKNNRSPRLTVQARVVGKRTQMLRHRQGNSRHDPVSTKYFVTFEVESGDRMELSMSGMEYGMLVEGDNGCLTFQGTRYLGFERR